MGIGDWGLGIAIPNPQSTIPNHYYIKFIIIILKYYLLNYYFKILN